MGMSLGGNGRARAEINMTPMIDVLLVLIIIFMIITPTKSHGLHALVPQQATSDSPGSSKSTDIVISVHRDGVLALNQEPTDLVRLHERLVRLFAEGGAINAVFVKGDGDLEFGSIAEVIDVTKHSGVSRIALMPN
jgi:biopolymer transport protein TolR